MPDAQDYIRKQLDDAGVANSPLVFPTQAMYAKAHDFYTFKNYAGYQHWNSIFNPIIQS